MALIIRRQNGDLENLISRDRVKLAADMILSDPSGRTIVQDASEDDLRELNELMAESGVVPGKDPVVEADDPSAAVEELDGEPDEASTDEEDEAEGGLEVDIVRSPGDRANIIVNNANGTEEVTVWRDTGGKTGTITVGAGKRENRPYKVDASASVIVRENDEDGLILKFSPGEEEE